MSKYKKYFSHFSLRTFHFAPSSGYTLIELLTVIGILSVVGMIVVSVVIISLQGAKKADVSEVVRQNGDIALTQMVKSIRYAKKLTSPVSCLPATTTQSVTITSLSDNGQSTYSCAASTIASNGASLLNTTAVTMTSCTFTCSQQTLNDPPSIKIQFSLSAKNAGVFAETKATIPFESSVTMRNYTR